VVISQPLPPTTAWKPIPSMPGRRIPHSPDRLTRDALGRPAWSALTTSLIMSTTRC
jgi:hypothetical protein